MLATMESTDTADLIEAQLEVALNDDRYVTDGGRSITFLVDGGLLTDSVKNELVRRTQKVGLAVAFVNTDVTLCYVTIVNTL